jgi:5-methylcytosine-specific restriction endonuclease McrA
MTMARVCIRCGSVVTGECACKPATTDNRRENSHRRGYTNQWRAFRKRLWQHVVRKTGTIPKCAMCGKSLGQQVHFDHKTPIKSAEDPLFYEPTNIQFLHPHCHAAKTAEDMRKGLTR